MNMGAGSLLDQLEKNFETEGKYFDSSFTFSVSQALIKKLPKAGIPFFSCFL